MDTETVAQGLLGAAVSAIGAYLLKIRSEHNDRILKIERDQVQADKDFAAHKLESEKRYAKEETLQNSLARIHDKIETGFAEIRDDIKDIRDYVIRK